MEMRTVQQGTFAFLPPLTDEEIRKQMQWILDQGYVVSVEYTDDPSPRNLFWRMWGLPMFGVRDAAAIWMEFESCRKAFPDQYIKINGYDPMRQGQAVSFVAHWPAAA